jgi:hypothetical protein
MIYMIFVLIFGIANGFVFWGSQFSNEPHWNKPTILFSKWFSIMQKIGLVGFIAAPIIGYELFGFWGLFGGIAIYAFQGFIFTLILNKLTIGSVYQN